MLHFFVDYAKQYSNTSIKGVNNKHITDDTKLSILLRNKKYVSTVFSSLSE